MNESIWAARFGPNRLLLTRIRDQKEERDRMRCFFSTGTLKKISGLFVCLFLVKCLFIRNKPNH